MVANTRDKNMQMRHTRCVAIINYFPNMILFLFQTSFSNMMLLYSFFYYHSENLRLATNGGCINCIIFCNVGSLNRMHSHGKDKKQNNGSLISKHEMIKIMWLIEKKLSFKNNDTLNLWRNGAIWIILQEIGVFEVIKKLWLISCG